MVGSLLPVAGLALVAPILAACTVTRQGTLEESTGTAALPVSIALTSDSAWLRVVDHRTGEVLEGQLALDPSPTHGRPAPHPYPAIPSGSAGLGAAGAGVPLRVGPVMNLSGLLRGDRGTTLACTIQVKQRLRLRGTGWCHDPREGARSSLRLRF